LKVCLFLNHACNLRCSYCYNGRKFDRRMPDEVALRAVELAFEAPDGQDVQISFFGGEPLLEMPLLQRSVDHALGLATRQQRTVRFVVVTNGTLLRSDTLDYLLQQRFYFGVSVDGCREAHDATRRFAHGGSSYDTVSRNIGTLLTRGAGAGLRVIAVIDPANVHLMAESFDALLDLGARHVSMNVNYEADWDDEHRTLFAEALDVLGDRYVAAYRRGARFTLNLLDSKIVTHLNRGYACADRCDFGCEEVAVAPSGRLYPCDRLVGQDDREDVVIGHVDTGVDPARRDDLIRRKNQVLEGCADCALLPRCMHWCGCINRAMTGTVGEVSGLLCWFEQQVIELADRVAATLYDERCEGFLLRFYGP